MKMRSLLRKVWIGIALITMTIVLAGCSAGDGATVDTTLTINKDMSGVRTMVVTINPTAFDSNFNGTIDDLDALITTTCPPEITWSREGDGSSSTYTAQIEFSSVQDYKDKVESILGEETTLEISAPDSVWASGFMAHEGFSSLDLLEAIKSATVNAGYVSSDYSNEILSDKSYNAIYDGTQYESGSYGINIDEIVSLPLNSITEYTDIHSDNTYDRKIEFDIPLSSMSQKETEITDYMDALAVDGATSTWEDEEVSKKYTVEKKGMDVAGLDAYTKAILDSDQCTVEATAGEQSEAFTFSTMYDEHQDFSSYISGDGGSIQVSYYVKPDNGVKVFDTYYGREYYSYEDNEYVEVWWDYVSSADTNLVFQKTYSIKAINSTINIKGSNKVEKTDEFVFADVPSEDDQIKMVDALKTLAGEETEGTDETEGKDDKKDNSKSDASQPKIESAIKDDSFSISINQSGKTDDIVSNDAKFYNTSEIRYLSQKSIISPRVKYIYTQYSDMSKLATALSDDFVLTCKIKSGILGSWNKPKNTKESSANEEDFFGTTYKGSTVTITSEEPIIDFDGQGSRWNIPGLLLWLVMILAIIIAILVMIKLKVPAKMKAHMAESKAKENAMRAQAMAQAQQNAQAQAQQQPQQPYQAQQQPQQPYQAQQQPQQPYQAQQQPQQPYQAQQQPQQPYQAQPQVGQQVQNDTNQTNTDNEETKFCWYCGNKLAKDAAFCNKCGQKQ